MYFPLFLASKYLKPKRSVASVIACVSVLGVMLGVAAVIIVRSVMTGFGDMWEEKILDFKPHISLSPYQGNVVTGEDELVPRLRQIEGVTCVTPQIHTRVLLSCRGRVLAPVILGVAGEDLLKGYRIGPPVEGSYDLDGDSIVLGRHAARQLGVRVGDEVAVYSPKTLAEQDEVFLPVKWRVSGIFASGHYEYDSGYVVASLYNLRELMGLEKGVFAVQIKTDAPTDHARFAAICRQVSAVCPRLRLTTWQEADSELFSALAVEKNMTAVLLSLISLVALFCVMNTLLVLTVQKTPEIGLLKALGFGRLRIMSVFVIHGLIQCTAGVVLGLLASWAVLANLQGIVNLLGRLGMQVFPEAIYGLAEIPHRIIFSDVVWTVASVFVFGLIASLIPASLAAAKDPVKALNE
ncbi:MAG: ABC transporter permease [Kiritimatiellia bacterium]